MPDLDNIPATKSAEELDALRASDPAAFDLDAAPAAEKTPEEVAAEAAKTVTTIDKRQYDGVLGDLRDTRGHLAAERAAREALAAELAELKAGPKIDYDAEITTLDKKFNEDDDFTHEDYIAQRDKLLVGKVKAEARAEVQQEQAQAAAQKAEQAWAEAANAFAAAHPEYADPSAKTDLEAALHGVFAKFPDASDADKLERAHKMVLAMNGKAEPAPATPPAGPHAARDAADAQAAAKASAAPPAIAGGVSSAGGPIANIDMANMKPGSFSKLSKDQQEAALGGPGAL